jgi:hypothetical protein
MPRFSLRILLIVVLILAADFAVLRYAVRIYPGPERVRAALTAMSTLPMANFLLVRAFRKSRRTGASRSSIVGYQITGWLAVFVTASIILLVPNDWVMGFGDAIFNLLMRFEPYRNFRHAGTVGSSAFAFATNLVILWVVVASLFVPPQLLAAFAGGRLASRFVLGSSVTPSTSV